jgi:hypothetical protein
MNEVLDLLEFSRRRSLPVRYAPVHLKQTKYLTITKYKQKQIKNKFFLAIFIRDLVGFSVP